MARRKKIPVTSGMRKDDLIKAIKKDLRKIEAKKKSKTAPAKTRKRTSASKTAKKTPKKKSSKTSKIKTARKPKTTALKKTTVKRKVKKAPVKKFAARKPKTTTPKKGPAKGKAKKTPAKKSAARKPKTDRPPKTVTSRTPFQPVETDLPDRYGDHRLVVLARDPNWAYAYWDLDAARVRDLLHKTGQSPDRAHWILRVYTTPLHPAEDKGHYFDVDVDVKFGSYYLDLARPGARFIVEIGVMDASGMFRSTAQSNPIILPLNHASETIAPEGIAPPKAPASPSGSGFNKPPSSRS